MRGRLEISRSEKIELKKEGVKVLGEERSEMHGVTCSSPKRTCNHHARLESEREMMTQTMRVTEGCFLYQTLRSIGGQLPRHGMSVMSGENVDKDGI
jgi:hypothetical protein